MPGKKELLQNLIGSALTEHPDLLDEINSLAGGFADNDLPFLDREDVNEAFLSNIQKGWRQNGVVIVDSLIPDDMIEAYRQDWIQHNRVNHDRPLGYPGECAYFQVESLMNIATYAPLHNILEHLIGDQMGIHLNLTGWKSTERNWHQDGYLNPDSNKDHYLAVWVALDDVHEDAGPFEYVPGPFI